MKGHLGGILRHLGRAALLGDMPTDGQLLDAYVRRRDADAFEAVVRRHGPMVWGVCLRVLRNHADAEDAFQATFLVLVRKAATLRDGGALANFLHGVAHNTALKARSMGHRRRVKERLAGELPRPETPHESLERLLPHLDDELGKLPDKFRAVIVLCDLEGNPIREAARHLGCPQGTVASRLARGRGLLAKRLARFGITLSAAGVAVLGRQAVANGVPPGLVASAVGVAAGTVSAKVAALTDGVLKVMLLSKLKRVVVPMVVGLLIAGAIGAAGQGVEGQPDRPAKNAPLPKPPTSRAVLKEARDAAEAIEDLGLKSATLRAIAEAQAGDREAATATFLDAIHAAKKLKSPDDHHALASIAVSQAEAGDFDGARETVRAVTDDGCRGSTLARLAAALARSGDLKGALKVADEVPADWKLAVLRGVALARAEAGDAKGAAQALDLIEDDYARVIAMLIAVPVHVRARDRDAAKDTLDKALRLLGQINVAGENGQAAAQFVAGAHAVLGDFEAARKAVEGISVPVFRGQAFLSILTAQWDADDVKGALKTIELIEDARQKRDALRFVLQAHLRAGDVKAAEKVIESLAGDAGHALALTELGKAQSRLGEQKAAVATFARAAEEAAKLSGEVPVLSGFGTRDMMLCRIAQAQSEAGEEDTALAWADKQTSPLVKAQALVNIAQGLAKRKPRDQ